MKFILIITKLGYPPGWLKKADMTHTTMDFIDGSEKTNDNLDDVINNGKLKIHEIRYTHNFSIYHFYPKAMKQKTYNSDSFFEYPGFNSPVPNGVRDVSAKML